MIQHMYDDAPVPTAKLVATGKPPTIPHWFDELVRTARHKAEIREGERLDAELARAARLEEAKEERLFVFLKSRLGLDDDILVPLLREPRPAGRITIGGFEFYIAFDTTHEGESVADLWVVGVCYVCGSRCDTRIAELADLGDFASQEPRCPRHSLRGSVIEFPRVGTHTRGDV